MPSALSPATLEGWFALHQIFRVDWTALRALNPGERDALAAEAAALLGSGAQDGESEGWSAAVRLVGGGADLLFVHFRPSLEPLSQMRLAVQRSPLWEILERDYEFLSVAEAALYHSTASVAAEHEPGSEAFERALAELVEAEAASPHVRSRLYPRVPEGMQYVSFYPMSKRRHGGDNWYRLPIDERSRLMRDHGLTGRRYSGKVFQVITGSVGFEEWEWGVTLFAREPLDFKRLVTDMRFDEVSARYGEFGRFFTGIRMEGDGWRSLLAAD
ncbi:MAG TPA: hydrogen peroxide-dependent heme synthase [Longimicrobiaceae bacterium]